MPPCGSCGPWYSPSSTAKPILQSMAGNSIQAVTKDEWGPPAGGEQGVKSQPGGMAGGQGLLGQVPTVGHDHHGHLGLVGRVAGLQKDCFKVKASCVERRPSAGPAGLPRARPRCSCSSGLTPKTGLATAPTRRHGPRSPSTRAAFGAGMVTGPIGACLCALVPHHRRLGLGIPH